MNLRDEVDIRLVMLRHSYAGKTFAHAFVEFRVTARLLLGDEVKNAYKHAQRPIKAQYVMRSCPGDRLVHFTDESAVHVYGETGLCVPFDSIEHEHKIWLNSGEWTTEIERRA